MMTATINNYSVYETRRQDFVFSISYDDDLLKAEELLKGMVDRHPMVLQDPAPMVKVKEHGSSSVNLLVRVWCKSENYWDLQFDLLEQVKLAFDENGLSIPFNQLERASPYREKGRITQQTAGRGPPLRQFCFSLYKIPPDRGRMPFLFPTCIEKKKPLQ